MMTLGIDCAPGTPRPSVYALVVFNKLGVAYVEPDSKCFGAWTWSIDVSHEAYAAIKTWLKEYMDELYKRGSIRGAEWVFANESL